MFCKKCGGRVMLDRTFATSKKKKGDRREDEESAHVELFCMMCGKRWTLNKETSVFAKWLAKNERIRNGALGTSS